MRQWLNLLAFGGELLGRVMLENSLLLMQSTDLMHTHADACANVKVTSHATFSYGHDVGVQKQCCQQAVGVA